MVLFLWLTPYWFNYTHSAVLLSDSHCLMPHLCGSFIVQYLHFSYPLASELHTLYERCYINKVNYYSEMHKMTLTRYRTPKSSEGLFRDDLICWYCCSVWTVSAEYVTSFNVWLNEVSVSMSSLMTSPSAEKQFDVNSHDFVAIPRKVLRELLGRQLCLRPWCDVMSCVRRGWCQTFRET